jgi:hypothetical protein
MQRNPKQFHVEVIFELIKNKLTDDIYIIKAGEGIKNKNKLIVETYNDSLKIPDKSINK